jgi:hypothetical protein
MVLVGWILAEFLFRRGQLLSRDGAELDGRHPRRGPGWLIRYEVELESLFVGVREDAQVRMSLLCHHLGVVDGGHVCLRRLKCLWIKIQVLSNCDQLLHRVIFFKELP